MKYGCVIVIKLIWYYDYIYCCFGMCCVFYILFFFKIKYWCDFVVIGYFDFYRNLDILVVEYLGVEDVIIVFMGFAINLMNMLFFVGKVCIFWV